MASPYEYRALYLHVPFCAKRCNYCDFQTAVVLPDDPELDLYVESLVHDVRLASREGLLSDIETIYIGGGTPTYLGDKRLVKLVSTVSESITLNRCTEFTVEANPESLTYPLMHGLAALGVNRVSIGVQSFVDTELVTLGRIHDAKAAQRAIALAFKCIDKVSIDLMCGIPQQDSSSWQSSLDTAIKSGVNHVSVYPLTIEEDTPFAKKVSSGVLQVYDDDAQADFMELAAEKLTCAGYSRYEVASYAQPGFESRHNIVYWTGRPYLGLGRGAAGMREINGYRERLLNGVVVERLNAEEAILEDIMLGMRMSKGVSFELVKRATGITPKLADTIEELIAYDLVVLKEGRYRPTTKGWLMGNELYSRIWFCKTG